LGLLCSVCSAADGGGSWLAAGWAIARGELTATPEASPAAGAAGEKRPYTPWRERVGPAYPDDRLRSFGRWAQEMPETLWDDTKATFTNAWSLVGLALAIAARPALHSSGVDERVVEHYQRHGNSMNGFWDSVGDAGGHPGLHFGIAGVMYFTSLLQGDVKTYERSKTLLNALSLNGLVTLALKGIMHTEVPNGGEFGWPSGHTSSTFCFAAVMYNEYGPWVGVPLYLFAAYVGWERVDAQNHDFSDVISGALLGIAIGHAVSANHGERLKVLGMDVVPWADPSRGAAGLALAKSW
jgi:membrane-associated phospholipid phosphatase